MQDGGGAGAAGASIFAAKGVLTAAAGIAGAGLGVAGLVSAANDFKKASQTYNDNLKEKASGFTKSSMVLLGTTIGSVIAPGIGTAIGAGVGGLLALTTGSRIGNAVGGWLDGSIKMEKTAKKLQEASKNLQNASIKLDNTYGAMDRYDAASKTLELPDIPEADRTQALDAQKTAIEELREMYPGLISDYDIENGRLEEKLRLIKEIQEAERRKARAELDSKVAQGEKELTQITNKLNKSYEKITGWGDKRESLYQVMPEIAGLESDYLILDTQRSQGTLSREDEAKRLEEFHKRADQINSKSGFNFFGADFAVGDASKLLREEIDKLTASIAKENEKIDKGAMAQYTELYKGKVQQIFDDASELGVKQSDIDRWNDLNEQIKGFSEEEELTEAQRNIQNEFDALNEKLEPVLIRIRDLNKEMNLIKDAKINISVAYTEQNKPNIVYDSPIGPPEKAHAWGGIMNRPHLGLVAEDGPEAIIPLSNSKRGRGLSLLMKAGEIMGIHPYAQGGITDNASPATPIASPAPATTNASSSSIGAPVSINDINFNFQIDGNNSPESILEVIKTNISGITDELANRISFALQQAYSNLPTEMG